MVFMSFKWIFIIIVKSSILVLLIIVLLESVHDFLESSPVNVMTEAHLFCICGGWCGVNSTK